MNEWQWAFELCKANNWKFLPCHGGEPWFGYEAIAGISGLQASYVEKLVSKNRIQRHPLIAGLTKFSFFESCEVKDER